MTSETLVAGIDSSTQSTKVLLVRAEDGTVVDQNTAPHPSGTEIHPDAWWDALQQAGAGLLERAAAIGVGGQQHGMVALDARGEVVRPALLWNDLRSAPQITAVVDHLGGAQACADCHRISAGGIVHHHQAPLVVRERTRQRPQDRVRAPAARLADLDARRPSGHDHRPRGRLGHRLLLHPAPAMAARAGGVGAGPGPAPRRCPASPTRPRRWDAPRTAHCWPPEPATTWPPRSA